MSNYNLGGNDFSNKRPFEQEMSAPNKRTRLDHDHPQTPSPVLHVRNLPQDCTESELYQLASPFGIPVNTLILTGKNQAFIQLESVAAAISLMSFYAGTQAVIRNRPVYVQYSNRSEITSNSSSSSKAVESANSILLVTIMNMVYPVTIEVLNEIFSKYGQVLKIIIFMKAAGFQALIQYNDSNQASTAKMCLDGKNIYNGCCTLRIQFSNLNNLNVKYNNEKSRDFTNQSLPGNDIHDVHSNPPNMGGAPGLATAPGFPPGGDLVSQQLALRATAMPTMTPQAFPFQFPPMNAAGPGNPMMNDPNMAAAAVAAATMGQQMRQSGCVLLVSNLDPDRVTPDILFTLFGVYGDVVRVKILFNKKDTALVQVANPQQASISMVHLQGCELFGKPMGVALSKHLEVSLPRVNNGQESTLTKDYTDSPLHRFRVAGSKNYQNIAPPSDTLHVSNLPQNTAESTLYKAFAQHGTVEGVKFFEKDRRMALVKMSQMSEAVHALVNLHNTLIEDRNIRVSFSKTTIAAQNTHQQSTASSSGGGGGSAQAASGSASEYGNGSSQSGGQPSNAGQNHSNSSEHHPSGTSDGSNNTTGEQ